MNSSNTTDLSNGLAGMFTYKRLYLLALAGPPYGGGIREQILRRLRNGHENYLEKKKEYGREFTSFHRRRQYRADQRREGMSSIAMKASKAAPSRTKLKPKYSSRAPVIALYSRFLPSLALFRHVCFSFLPPPSLDRIFSCSRICYHTVGRPVAYRSFSSLS